MPNSYHYKWTYLKSVWKSGVFYKINETTHGVTFRLRGHGDQVAGISPNPGWEG